MIWAHIYMYDEQIKLKADSPQLWFAKESIISALLHESSVASEIAIGLCLFLDLESPWFYQQCNVSDTENPKREFKVESKVAVTDYVT